MKQEVTIGQADYTVLVMIRDTAGAPKTGLTNASAGIDVCYTRVETDNDVVLTAGAIVALVTPALTDVHLDWGFLQVDATNAPGLYRLDLPDGVFAAGAWSAVVSLIATGIDPCQIEFILVSFDPRDSVRLGLTALPNAAADGVGGLPISDAGGLDLDAIKVMTDKVGTVVNTSGTATIGAILGDFANSALVTRLGTQLTESQSHPTLTEIEATAVLAKQAKLDTIHDTRIPGVIQPQTGDSYGLANGTSGFVAIKGDTSATLLDTGTDGVVLPQAQADKVWATAARALTDKADFALSSASRDAVWDQASVLTLSFESLLTRAYQMVNNKMNVTDATGVVALRNIGNTGNIATGSVTDDLTTTVRGELAWA
jgi:hypothetical protein